MNNYYDAHHREVQFQEGDQVLLKLQSYRQMSLAARWNQKLDAKFYEPFTIQKRIDTIANQLDLPADSHIHPVFYVSKLKKIFYRPTNQ